MDRTADLHDLCVACATRNGSDQATIRKIKGAAILRPLPKHNDFTKTAQNIAGNIKTMSTFVQKHRPGFFHPELATERERDSIEEEVGLFVKTCTERVDSLKDLIIFQSSERRSAHVVAHLHGIVLILSERLKEVTETFDECRQARYESQLANYQHTQQLREQASSQRGAIAARRRGQDDRADDSANDGSVSGLQMQHSDMLADELEGLVDQVPEEAPHL
ncbi:Qa-SNARE, syp8/Ufe1p/Syntaxin 18-type [Cymbomonas tetramitiformis]|uniref:Qa-SNARE, syp8/Ufe1p/Syntaxin 18-type n=1 Tax=Cymbomonas tetramitiformis TaxID=36881 RepID=A0AAE0LA52_9CHLO|nr:Qa-SNARE, syp8/Ufe1p/Syntaxin 18-type [Cymbomonas tetramitiformis]